MNNIELPEFPLPKIIEIEPIQGCNFKCTMCHVSVMKPDNVYLDKRFLDNIGHFPKGTHVALGTSFEPTMHPDFAEIVQKLSDKGLQISMTTNGSKFSNKLINDIKDVNFYRVTFSFDSANKTSFEKIRINANFDKVTERFLKFKNSVTKDDVYFTINSTIINENAPDILETVKFAEREKFNAIGLIAAVYRVNDTVLNESDFVYSNIDYYKNQVISTIDYAIKHEFNVIISSALVVSENLKEIYPDKVKNNLIIKDATVREHLSINELQLGKMKGMPVDCLSPFVHVRIKNDGKVMLCNRHAIGDIYTETLESIWYGDKANYVRKKLMAEPSICYSCSYFKFCLNQKNLKYEQDTQSNRTLNTIIDTSNIIDISNIT
ncbi:radical SAM protein [Thalassotalea sp. G2M2-11]|uniref:radical SAM protein n=1 Tax=Thalassotalea sp. G2M2-11 TaxID=2787627 RepID=UPI0019D06CAC|nr:radical SAM protein [Thalassotalea sp. G2M2-11]